MLAFDPFLIAKRYGEAPMSPLSGRAIFQAPYQQPVWKDVDVVVIGSTTGAVAAAMAAADAGAKVFVASPLSYMGRPLKKVLIFQVSESRIYELTL